MKDWGRYQLVATPGDADLIFEIRFAVTVGAITVSQGSGYSSEDPQIRLAILDPKTHVMLWGFTEEVRKAARQGTERKKLR
jgi:hypothetical protein